MAGTARTRGGRLVRGSAPGTLAVVAAALLAGCGVSAGTKPVDQPAAGPAEAAATGLTLPCQPGSGWQVTSAGPMNLTDLSGQRLSCAVFAHLTLNQVSCATASCPARRSSPPP